MFSEVEATYSRDKGVLSGPIGPLTLNSIITESSDPRMPKADTEVRCDISISQGPKRTIRIVASELVYWSRLLGPLYQLERLLMLFDGRFIPLVDLKFTDNLNESFESGFEAEKARKEALRKRLKYFDSADYLQIDDIKLIEFQDVLTSELFGRWLKLLDELDIINQMYLYAVSDNGMPMDVPLAFLTELAEPMVEILKEQKGLYEDLHPGKRGTLLLDCLKALADQYGSPVFDNEPNLDLLLLKLKENRHRIMHIKREQQHLQFDRKDCVLYINKLSLVYRHIIFDLLGITQDKYYQQLEKITSTLDSWMKTINYT